MKPDAPWNWLVFPRPVVEQNDLQVGLQQVTGSDSLGKNIPIHWLLKPALPVYMPKIVLFVGKNIPTDSDEKSYDTGF